MITDCFFDTNILVYAAIGQNSHRGKFERAVELIGTENFGTSAQVLAEFYVNVIKKSDVPLTPTKAAEWVAIISKKPCQAVDEAVVMRGVEISQRYDISCWDGAIIAAADRLGATTLFTEDLNHGQSYGSVTAINPFIEH